MGILEMKGWIDQGPAFASPQLPLSIVAERQGLLIELCTFLPKEPLCKGSVQINLGTCLVQTGTVCHPFIQGGGELSFLHSYPP